MLYDGRSDFQASAFECFFFRACTRRPTQAGMPEERNTFLPEQKRPFDLEEMLV